jgi:hypothetical protein
VVKQLAPSIKTTASELVLWAGRTPWNGAAEGCNSFQTGTLRKRAPGRVGQLGGTEMRCQRVAVDPCAHHGKGGNDPLVVSMESSFRPATQRRRT